MIEPITDALMLHEEGRRQHNCVLSLLDDVTSGRSFIYRVLRPERATLEIVRHEDGYWTLRQLLAACNRPVRAETTARVEEWLEEQRRFF